MEGKLTDEDIRTIARAYIDDVLKLQKGERRPSDEDYERGVASAEVAFRRLAMAGRQGSAPAGDSTRLRRGRKGSRSGKRA
jgi:hypothetical protein